uniref:Uncharacterized protein n=1 Tax=Knipowitschia caucasica TaxID=637954 RepID=A0AAV2K5R5_KNICA
MRLLKNNRGALSRFDPRWNRLEQLHGPASRTQCLSAPSPKVLLISALPSVTPASFSGSRCLRRPRG